MAKTTDEHALEACLKEVQSEFVCVLPKRAALRVAPVLGQVPREEEEERRRDLLLLGFRAAAVDLDYTEGPHRRDHGFRPDPHHSQCPAGKLSVP